MGCATGAARLPTPQRCHARPPNVVTQATTLIVTTTSPARRLRSSPCPPARLPITLHPYPHAAPPPSPLPPPPVPTRPHPSPPGLRRRGVPPTAVNAFCRDIGITRNENLVLLHRLEHFVRTELDATSPRALAVLRPLKVGLTGEELMM